VQLLLVRRLVDKRTQEAALLLKQRFGTVELDELARIENELR
jgi:hypothetical protein